MHKVNRWEGERGAAPTSYKAAAGGGGQRESKMFGPGCTNRAPDNSLATPSRPTRTQIHAATRLQKARCYAQDGERPLQELEQQLPLPPPQLGAHGQPGPQPSLLQT